MHFMGDSCQLHQSALLLRYSKLKRFYCRLSLFFQGGSSMAFLLIPVILLAVVWLSYICRRLSELNENVNTAMNQIGLQLSSRFRALEALLELARTHGLSAQLVLLPPSINALSTPA